MGETILVVIIIVITIAGLIVAKKADSDGSEDGDKKQSDNKGDKK